MNQASKVEGYKKLEERLKEQGGYFKIDQTIPDRWHSELDVKWEETKDSKYTYHFRCTQVESGCGSMILSGYYNSMFSKDLTEQEQKTLKEVAEVVLKVLRNSGVGALITTLGDNIYMDTAMIQIIDAFKMEKISSYVNYRHSENYIQSLFLRVLP